MTLNCRNAAVRVSGVVPLVEHADFTTLLNELNVAVERPKGRGR